MTPRLETLRLWLRPLEIGDAEQVQSLFPRWEIIRYLAAVVPWPYPAHGALTHFRDVALPAVERGEAWHWTLRRKEAPDQLIGAINLNAGERENRGFWVALPWQGLGYATEACAAVTAYWFDVLGQPALRVGKAAANEPSRRISQREGMRLVGTEEREFVSGRLPAELWEITADEWRRRRAGTRAEPERPRGGRRPGSRAGTATGGMAEERNAHDVWGIGAAYEAYVGRWSRPVAREFVRWLGVPRGRRWLDVGCGSGSLVEAISEQAEPRAALGIDRSKGFVAHARARATGANLAFQVGDARALPVPAGAFDAVVSGLVLNFVPDPARMVAEMARAGRAGGTIALYVWDYGAGMELMRHFWNAARALDPAAATLDEAVRFPICAPGPLEELFEAALLTGVATRAIDVPTRFRDFDDYWSPFLGGQGPAPAYAMSVSEDRRVALRELVRSRLPVAPDGSIPLSARAWAVRGSVPGAPAPR